MLQIKKSCVYLWCQTFNSSIGLYTYITDSICGKPIFKVIIPNRVIGGLATETKKACRFFRAYNRTFRPMPNLTESAMTAKHSTRCAFVQETRSAAENMTADFAATSSGVASMSAFLFGIHGLNNQPAIL